MKKSWKYFLVGAGAVVAGFFAYALFKDRPEDDTLAEPATDTTPPRTSSESHISPEFIERRRELYRRRAAERTASSASAQEDLPQANQESPAEKPEGQETADQEPKPVIAGPIPMEEAPADCSEDSVSVDGTGSDVPGKESGSGEEAGENGCQDEHEEVK